MLAKKGQKEALVLADLFCREARRRVKAHFSNFYGANDHAIYRISQQILRGEHSWLEQGIVGFLGESAVKREEGSGKREAGSGKARPKPAAVGQ
jgi:hypothetical protein